ncbi:MAG: hypothetical protein ABFD03_00305 [Clostridiaceae bacterium]
MVCKECGTFNAENQTLCKFCGAKLRDDDAGAATEETSAQREEGKPSRDFVKAPSWPTRAFSGAPDQKSAGSAPTPAASAPSGSFRPSIPPRVPAAAPSAASFCAYCGKPTLPDAPFCPYCGKPTIAEAAPAAAPVRASAKPVAPAPVRQPAKKDFDDDDYDDEDEEEEDYAPKKPAKRGANKVARKDDFDDEDEEVGEYDEEYDEDDEEYDALPKKRGKGTTILFWGLIVLLLALIAVFGIYIAKKNFDGDFAKMFASIGSVFNKNSSSDVDATDTTDTDATASNMYTASISEYTDPTTSELYFNIDIYAPTGSTVRIITDATLENNTATVPSNDHVILRISRDVFMPNAPVESEVITITPNIQVISPDGQTTQLTVPDITVTVPVLSMTVTEPATDTVTGTFDNSPIAIIGQVNDYDAETAVFINDQQVYVDSTGMFTSSYTPTATVNTTQPTTTPEAVTTTPDPSASPETTEEAAETTEAETAEPEAAETAAPTDSAAATTTSGTETITIEARKNNCVTARKVITVEPYVMQNLSFLVTNELATLSSDTGSVTVTGTATPGTKITATCASTDVTFGEATVSETGTFSLAVSIAKVGAFDITLTGELEGYYKGTAIATVERPPEVSSSTFKKAAGDLGSSYEKIVAGTITSGDFVCTGTITDIIATEPYAIFRIKLSDGSEVICANRSAKSTINSSDLKEKKQVAGTLKGLYTDGTTPYLWTWFIWNK